MTSKELTSWFDHVLETENFAEADSSKNGLQVDNDGAEITRVAFAVDACLETVTRANAAGAGMLVVHHGLFWKEPERVTGPHYRRLRALMTANMALYASHLPLDAHDELGNNAGLANRIGLIKRNPFGVWRGCVIGVSGSFEQPISLDALCSRLFPDDAQPPHLLPFGPQKIRTAAVVSGGASSEMYQAIDAGFDCFITGEIGHEEYHHALENKITVIAGGHYRTETLGVQQLAVRLGRETDIETVFIDVPTNL
ncbi:MAG TPA: Nif3-like dinuclear metal center hexameric protein [Treponema sp.]|nr:Nif3-like dinuclear metal center hexameric protein [Treponema sp.]